MNIICFIAGLIVGIIFLLLVQGASKISKEQEIFIDGYKAGLQERRKEIPQKPEEDVYGDKCPVCGKYVWGFVSKMNYCANCGQKIDWGDDDELYNTKQSSS